MADDAVVAILDPSDSDRAYYLLLWDRNTVENKRHEIIRRHNDCGQKNSIPIRQI
jgi:hypothetical protein